MLAGISPFRGESGRSVLAAILRAPPPGLSSRRSDVPSEIEAFVLRLLAKEPADRPPSAAAVITAIDGLRMATALPAR
jgi:serine/threonine-protein kinase